MENQYTIMNKLMAPEDKITILMADDDEDDRFFAKEALNLSDVQATFSSVGDGVALMGYLLNNNIPDIILLDLNMPCKDGREALNEIKTDPRLCNIPVAILSTSQLERDKTFAMAAGADIYINKPATIEEWVRIMRFIADLAGGKETNKLQNEGG